MDNVHERTLRRAQNAVDGFPKRKRSPSPSPSRSERILPSEELQTMAACVDAEAELEPELVSAMQDLADDFWSSCSPRRA